MPELMSHCRQAWELEQYMIAGAAKDQYHTKKTSPDRGYVDVGVHQGDATMFQSTTQSPKKSRAKESSKHFGVRFRPDLQKWVAEIRVAEWKTVDKKVWLGTFDSEEGAARAVDAARKLLKCNKKRPANFPCEALGAYSEKIPQHLDLNNVRDESMFKEVTLFVKRKAKEYAANLLPSSCEPASTPNCSLSDQLHPLLKSDVAPRHLFTLPEDDVSLSEYSPSTSPSSYGSFGTQFPCEAVIIMGDAHHHWNYPTSETTGTSPPEVDGSWVHMEPGMYNYYGSQVEQLPAHMDAIASGHSWGVSGDTGSQGSWEDLALLEELMFDMDGVIEEPCHSAVHDDDPTRVMDIGFHGDEVLYVDSQNNADSQWMSGPLLQQQNFNMPGYHSLSSNSMEYAQVC